MRTSKFTAVQCRLDALVGECVRTYRSGRQKGYDRKMMLTTTVTDRVLGESNVSHKQHSPLNNPPGDDQIMPNYQR